MVVEYCSEVDTVDDVVDPSSADVVVVVVTVEVVKLEVVTGSVVVVVTVLVVVDIVVVEVAEKEEKLASCHGYCL